MQSQAKTEGEQKNTAFAVKKFSKFFRNFIDVLCFDDIYKVESIERTVFFTFFTKKSQIVTAFSLT